MKRTQILFIFIILCSSMPLTAVSQTDRFTIVSGENQTGAVGSELVEHFVVLYEVEVSEKWFGLIGVTVTFEIIAGRGATLSTTSTSTGSGAHAGKASTKLTLGNTAGTYQVKATATYSGNTETVTFSATAATPTTLESVSGNNQTGYRDENVANPFVVKVKDENNKALSGATVTFAITSTPSGSSGQSLSPTSATTDSDGLAETELRFGHRTGRYTVTATVSGITPSLTFQAIAIVPPRPSIIDNKTGNNQTGRTNQDLVNPFSLRVKDQGSNPMSGIEVTFTVATQPTGSTGATVTPETTMTNSEGIAQATLRLGSVEGEYTVSAKVTGISGVTTFTATAVIPPPTLVPTHITTNNGNRQTGPVNSTLPNQLVAKVVDQNGDPLADVTVMFSISEDGSVDPSSSVTDSQGLVRTTVTLGRHSDSAYTITARIQDTELYASFVAFTAATITRTRVEDPIPERTPAETPIATPIATPTRAVARDSIIFNEIHNAVDDKHDWIEIKNITNREITLNSWEISIVTSSQDDEDIVSFSSRGLDYKLKPGALLLITNAPHTHTDLIQGQNIADPSHNPVLLPSYLVAPDLRLPIAPYLLILRNQPDLNGTPDQIEDVAGNYYREVVEDNTNIWPLSDTTVFFENTQFLTQGKAWQRTEPILNGYDPRAWEESGYKSGLGYELNADKATSLGTPGYSSDIYLRNVSSGEVVFSEIMFATNKLSWVEPQWIELYNTSNTKVVDLEGWLLIFENDDREDETRNQFTSINLKSMEILPKQTVLLVTGKSRHSDNILDRQIYNLSEHHGTELGLNTYPSVIFDGKGFSLELKSPDNTSVDKVGNMYGEVGNYDLLFEFPYGHRNRDKARVSWIRRFNEDGTVSTGDELKSWKRTAKLRSFRFADVKSYYGKQTDLGTPGYRSTTPLPESLSSLPLPVSLSDFSAEVMDTGVVIKWTTESELNNAGFNIYRSETKEGEFTAVNATLIKGAGTTGERNDYTWIDTSAKPNVAYYYQIEEVSFAGERQTLTTQRLKGIVSAKDRLTTLWGQLKR